MNYAARVFENAGGFCLPSSLPFYPPRPFPVPAGNRACRNDDRGNFFDPDTPIENIWSILIAKRQKICYNKKCFL